MQYVYFGDDTNPRRYRFDSRTELLIFEIFSDRELSAVENVEQVMYLSARDGAFAPDYHTLCCV